ncbi:DUF222 domain-containing protein [Mycolicibacterium farcinogenes]|nr:DUF222 domain-containing protein [Mycolicibacterium farcinogenes]
MVVGLVRSRDAVQSALAGHRAATAALVDVDFTGFDTAELLALQSERELQARTQAMIDHRIQAALMVRSSPHEVGGRSWTDVLATRMRMSRKEAARRVAVAVDLGPRYAVTGQELVPVLPGCAQALLSGSISVDHVAIVRDTLAKAEKYVGAGDLAQVESDLVAAARRDTPEALKAAADTLLYLLNQTVIVLMLLLICGGCGWGSRILTGWFMCRVGWIRRRRRIWLRSSGCGAGRVSTTRLIRHRFTTRHPTRSIPIRQAPMVRLRPMWLCPRPVPMRPSPSSRTAACKAGRTRRRPRVGIPGPRLSAITMRSRRCCGRC